ncbi:MAG: chemotaxis protein CheW [Gemmatimonadota bacterium]|nr:chemotaxis protein CheW [Gemmatimonadota bacterium]MDH5284638.1 chemotaxis protein CheW [Gemmatimonadota bacterium]
MSEPTTLRLLLFRLGPLVCAVPAGLVREVIPADPPVRIPGAAAAVAGLVNVRGTLLIVVDGRRAAGLPDSGHPAESVLIVDRGDRTVGLSVDLVEDLIEVGVESLVAGAAMPGAEPWLVRAVGEHAGLVFAVLDTEALFAQLG